MKLRIAKIEVLIGVEAVAAMTAVLLLDRGNRIICCFLAAALHELGHILMMRWCGVRVRRVRLRLFDALIEADEAPSFAADVLITLGGPAVNLLCAVVFCPFSLKLGLPHLMLGVFNLLPVMSLDGGHLAAICLSRRFSPRFCDLALCISTVIFLVPLTAAGFMILCRSGYNYSLLLIALYLTAILLLKQ